MRLILLILLLTAVACKTDVEPEPMLTGREALVKTWVYKLLNGRGFDHYQDLRFHDDGSWSESMSVQPGDTIVNATGVWEYEQEAHSIRLIQDTGGTFLLSITVLTESRLETQSFHNGRTTKWEARKN